MASGVSIPAAHGFLKNSTSAPDLCQPRGLKECLSCSPFPSTPYGGGPASGSFSPCRIRMSLRAGITSTAPITKRRSNAESLGTPGVHSKRRRILAPPGSPSRLLASPFFGCSLNGPTRVVQLTLAERGSLAGRYEVARSIAATLIWYVIRGRIDPSKATSLQSKGEAR